MLVGRERLIAAAAAWLAHGAAAMSDVVLETRGLVKRFGGITATNDVTFQLERGARHALIGPNGAGKTTLRQPADRRAGAHRPASIMLDGRGHHPARRRTRACGAAWCAPSRSTSCSRELTPLETLALAVGERLGLGGDWRPPRRRRATPWPTRSRRLLSASASPTCWTGRTDTLPYGKRRLLEIAAAFACEPRVLLLDEPAAGVPDGRARGDPATVAALPADVSVLLIEHDMDLVFSFAKRITVLVDGAPAGRRRAGGDRRRSARAGRLSRRGARDG